jgi:hypothetical protein
MAMTEELKGNPEGKHSVGSEKDDAGGAEVAGRGKKLLYTCFSCGSGNYVDPFSSSFTCWRCGGGNQGM